MPNTKASDGRKKYIQGIHCDVTNCIYNDQKCNCYADKITVGPGVASNKGETECSTFKQDMQ